MEAPATVRSVGDSQSDTPFDAALFAHNSGGSVIRGDGNVLPTNDEVDR
jgi:hypothetical protein